MWCYVFDAIVQATLCIVGIDWMLNLYTTLIQVSGCHGPVAFPSNFLSIASKLNTRLRSRMTQKRKFIWISPGFRKNPQFCIWFRSEPKTIYLHRPQIAWKAISHFHNLWKRFKMYKFQLIYIYRYSEARYRHKYKCNIVYIYICKTEVKIVMRYFMGAEADGEWQRNWNKRLWVVCRHVDLTLL